jgi:hypothetical protein
MRRRWSPAGARAAATALLSALTLAAGPAAHAARTLAWTATPDDLPQGNAEGMALTSRGRMFLAPRLTALGGSQTPEGPAQVWAVARGRDGQVYLGTGPEGQILKIGPSGQPRLHFTVDEPMVTALAIGRDGELLAGAAPGGVIYRIGHDGTGEPWVATEELYVWSLVVDDGGDLYAGTGERGRILRIGSAGQVELLFDTRESHIVSLHALPGGGLLAGGASHGLVYRVDREGHALVLHDDELPEVVALVAEPGGAVLAALVAPPEPPSKRPALRLRLPDGVQVGTTDEAVGTLEESSGPVLRGHIEGLARKEEAQAEGTLGRVVRIGADGAIDELWSSSRESPFCLARDAAGRSLFGTGEPARLYRVETDGDVALLATLREAQLTGLAQDGAFVVLATSNPAAAYRLDDAPGDAGTYESRPFDAGGPARWGSIRWRVDDPASGSTRTEVYTRTGNSREPDETWSAWSPALTDPGGGDIVNPDGRFLQWRVRQVGASSADARVDEVSVRYAPYNRRPRIEQLRVEGPGGASDDTRVFHWSVSDPDDDLLTVTLDYRPLGAAAWARAAETYATVAATANDPGGRARAGELAWDTADVSEGEYEVRGTVSDQPANPPGEGFEVAARQTLRLVVDRTAPEIEILAAEGGATRVRVEDTLSVIRALEVIENGRTRFVGRPEDGVCDGRRETFRIEPGDAGAGDWSIRGIDAAGNAVERPLPPGRSSN